MTCRENTTSKETRKKISRERKTAGRKKQTKQNKTAIVACSMTP